MRVFAYIKYCREFYRGFVYGYKEAFKMARENPGMSASEIQEKVLMNFRKGVK